MLLVTSLISGCSIAEKKKDEEPVTIKVLTPYKNEFEKFETILKTEFPHISYETVGIIELMNKEGNTVKDYNARITELMQEHDADLYFNFNPELYWKEIQLANLNTYIQKK
ncbi:hypothetical protein D3P07_14955 [Paenibacillus sp. 1011MAR3C5]|nr:hypothetical protein D3P07_14955 [Paenibacillus sp. 1011MAR3C5]